MLKIIKSIELIIGITIPTELSSLSANTLSDHSPTASIILIQFHENSPYKKVSGHTAAHIWVVTKNNTSDHSHNFFCHLLWHEM